MKRLLLAIAVSLSLSAEAASLTVQTSDAQVAAGATLAFACFRGPDLHLRFEQVPAEQQLPVRSVLEVSDGRTSQLLDVDLRAFKLGDTQEVGITLSTTPALGVLMNTDADLQFRLPQLAVPLSARFAAGSVQPLSRMVRRCR